MNIQGLKPKTVQSKVPFVEDVLKENNKLLIGLTETWLKDQKEGELNIDGYSLQRGDRERKKLTNKGRDSGGAAFYIRNDLASTLTTILEFSNSVVEVLCLYSRVENLLLIVFYRQPDDVAHGHPSTSKQFNEALMELKKAIDPLDQPLPDIFMGGDFNLPLIDWQNNQPEIGCSKDTKLMFNLLTEFTNDLCMKQYVNKPTHKDGNILDLFFTNNDLLVNDLLYSKPLNSITHHCIVEVATTYRPNIQRFKERKAPPRTGFHSLNFFHEDVNWDEINTALLEYDWVREFKNKRPEQVLILFLDICFEIVKDFVPLKKTSRTKTKSQSEKERNNLVRRRRRINKALHRSKSLLRKNVLQKELIQIEKAMMNSYKENAEKMETKALKSIKSNSKYFFNYVKKFSKVKSNIGPLCNDDGKLVSDPKEKAEMLAKQYASVFSTPRDLSETERTTKPTHTLHDIRFNEDDIVSSIDELKINSASGLLGYPAILLKKCKYALTEPLYILWRRCLDAGRVPALLKHAIITPIHKGKSRSIAANYRPVALTSHLIKIFEKVLRKNIVQYMDEHKLFNETNHGFRQARSCLSQLLAHYDDILNLLEQGINVDVVYLDFAKAFDKVDFNIVLQKIRKLGIDGNLYCWIESFLTNRMQTVVVEGSSSTPVQVKSGVPQGSVLGPLIFLILMADIDMKVYHSLLKSFADDTRVLKGVLDINDVSKLQSDLNNIYEWADKNNMEFNDLKFEVLRYGRDEALKTLTNYLSSTGTVIDQKNSVRDLGVTMSADASFTEHINNVVDTAKKTISTILRTFKSREPQLMITLWKSVVLPQLEYCSQLWSPTKKQDIVNLELLQKNYLRKISGAYELDYWERLKKFSIFSLQRRRERYQIIYVWKMLENLVPNVGVAGANSLRNGRTCIIPTLKRDATQRIQNLRESSLAVHGARLFNCLPKNLRDMSGQSIDTFKRNLDKFLRFVPDEPLVPGYTAMRKTDSNSLLDLQGTIKDITLKFDTVEEM